ncbi:uncharacterized protein Z520_03111 [Fonsecaea multimorphosa CBS 102226]|uniref:Xylanolytic transcriptional activator regulatory domain-containing protein n=1 Tax=Fonsecaea multimorphosa CBS 102226 TaxID=1442371 RepID=A0A0D2KXL0_9EURO|nr:uncharacterized protein Z520_03111 [Fonsecaea multimorphosa CBS 102226]KIY01559.1 hypothetical protein Z520_03111 [Fonsecaea multimorphosa CBS 102226]OAL28073.1 hypothetical protein AYO22_03100 [Fonsecaea multimorphosa]
MQGKDCVYKQETPQRRPTLARIHELQKQNSVLDAFISKLKSASPTKRERLLTSVTMCDGHVRLPDDSSEERTTETRFSPQPQLAVPSANQDAAPNISHRLRRRSSLGSLEDSSDEEFDIGPFLSVDEAGKPSSFGPSSALHYHPRSGSTSLQSAASLARDHIRNCLIAEAALQRQNERHLALLPDVHGVPTELAIHLLELHWSRQHHTLLLTYRPAIIRDLLRNGPHCSRFLLHAIFACTSKFSARVEVRDDPSDPSTAGRRFFRRCDELLAEDSLLIYPKLPTVVGLLLLGSSYNAKGETSKGWLYTGYALRMVYDLGLHLDPKETSDSPEQVEIRRRVFWGAFVSDKLQSLYLGRPAAINLRDSHVSRDFMDTLEEQELYVPYKDPKYPSPQTTSPFLGLPIYSVSTFQQLCLLSKIMTKIINTFYVVGATPRNAQASLQLVDNALQAWRENLPTNLDFQPRLLQSDPTSYPPPNLMNVHALYHSLLILLHRPFISDGHLRSTATPSLSWGRCTSAARSITSIALAWKTAYSLRGAPYLLSYAIYVACTIHVRNAAADASSGNNREHTSLLAASLSCLEQLCLANPGVSKPMKIIQRLMEASKIVLQPEETIYPSYSPSSFDLDTIFSMFPPRTVTSSNVQYSGEVIFDSDIPDDPLFGLMDEPMLPYTDMSDNFFNGTRAF